MRIFAPLAVVLDTTPLGLLTQKKKGVKPKPAALGTGG